MKRSGSAQFPFGTDNENNCLQRAETVEDIILSAIRLYIITKRGSRVGNLIGSIIPDLLLELIAVKTFAALAEQLQSDLINQFPGVDFISVSMTRDLTYGTVDLLVDIQLTLPNQSEIIGLTERFPSKFEAKYFKQ